MAKGDEKEVKIVFDDFQDIEDDIEKIQTKPGMYIGYHGPKLPSIFHTKLSITRLTN